MDRQPRHDQKNCWNRRKTRSEKNKQCLFIYFQLFNQKEVPVQCYFEASFWYITIITTRSYLLLSHQLFYKYRTKNIISGKTLRDNIFLNLSHQHRNILILKSLSSQWTFPISKQVISIIHVQVSRLRINDIEYYIYILYLYKTTAVCILKYYNDSFNNDVHVLSLMPGYLFGLDVVQSIAIVLILHSQNVWSWTLLVF